LYGEKFCYKNHILGKGAGQAWAQQLLGVEAVSSLPNFITNFNFSTEKVPKVAGTDRVDIASLNQNLAYDSITLGGTRFNA
jgi:hypothetical protein